MPVQTLEIRFQAVSVLEDSDTWGAGEWHLHASVDGLRVGNPDTEFSVHSGDFLMLPNEQWNRVVDVSGHGPGSTVQIAFHVIEKDVFSDDNLGRVTATLRYPYDDPYHMLFLESPMLSGGLFSDDYRCYTLIVIAKHLDEVATTTATGPTRIPITRSSHGAATFNSVRGEQFTPRVDIHPVVPVPSAPSHVVRPVRIPAGMAAARVTPDAQVPAAPAAPALNSMANPSLIPILAATDPDLANRVARLAITAYQPGNLDPANFFWIVKSGPAVIVGGNTGLSVQVRGTGTSTTDQMAVFEVHWENATGALLATYRAWVGRLGTLRYRVNRLNGRPTSTGGPTPYPVTTLMPDANVDAIMDVVRAIIFQAGLLLIPDDVTTGWEGAVHSSNAIFDLTVADDNHTNNVSHDVIAAATRYNFRPGTINFAIVFTTGRGNAAAVDRNGIEGDADTAKSMGDGNAYSWSGEGVKKKLGGSPSVSWIKPAGVGRDAAGVDHEMETIQPSDRVRQAKDFDKNFVTARKAANPSFTAARMGELYACQVPARWALSAGVLAGTPAALSNYVWNCGINFAHELGHVLGLAHRGNAGQAAAASGPSVDGMNFTDSTGAQQGHPWRENVMTYGYGGATPLAHDIDLLQTLVVRRHPAIRH